MIEVEIESADDEATQVIQDPAPADLAETIEAQADGPDTMITIIDTQQEDRQLLVALSGGRAFVGLVSGGQQFQLTDQNVGGGAVEMAVGGQRALIARRFAVEPEYAGRAAMSFVEGDPVGDSTLSWDLR